MTTPLIFVIDTSALLGRLKYAADEVQLATTPVLVEEMIRKGLKTTIQMLIDTQKLRILTPTTTSLHTVVATATTLGDLKSLSQPDKDLLALALDLSRQGYHVVVLTDDYSIQNVAKRLSLEFLPASERGILEVIQWETYCPGCLQRFPKQSKGKPCPTCGTPLKRRAVKKQRIKQDPRMRE